MGEVQIKYEEKIAALKYDNTHLSLPENTFIDDIDGELETQNNHPFCLLLHWQLHRYPAGFF